MDRLLDDLDPHQRAAVTEPHQPLAILAPAGSGKTRVLTRRIAYRVREGLAEPRHVLTVTFTRRAAGELVDRLDALGVDTSVTAGTFHALALAQLRRRAADTGREPPRVLDRKGRILGPLIGAPGPRRILAVSDVATEIDWAKARMIPPDRYEAAARAAERRLPRSPAELADLYARYEAEKRKRRWHDFDDLLGFCADAIETDPDFAAAQRWRFRHLFVDEFQDATPLQVRLLRAWLGGRPDLSVVGDNAQAIYGFSGATAAPLAEFAQTFAGGRITNLRYNYRSTEAIVDAAEAALGSAAGPTRDVPRAVRPSDRPTIVRAFVDDAEEAAVIADTCWHQFTSGVPQDQIAILVRTNAQLPLFEAALQKRGVPFRVVGANRFASRPDVAPLIDRMRRAERDAPRTDFSVHLADAAADVDFAPDPEADTAAPAPGEPQQPRETLTERNAKAERAGAGRDALLRLGREYAASERTAASVAGFVSWLEAATPAEAGQDRGVDLVTFHRAKGLEWQIVFVTGLERGLAPISWAKTPPALAEERRLLHVALSRPADWLHCSWARLRRGVERRPSPWLAEIELAAARHPATPVDPKARLGDALTTLQQVDPPAPTSHSRRMAR